MSSTLTRTNRGRTGPWRYHLAWLPALVLGDVEDEGPDIRNVLEWGKTTRLKQIKAVVDHLPQEQIKGAMRHLGLAQMENGADVMARLEEMQDAEDILCGAVVQREPGTSSLGRYRVGHSDDGPSPSNLGAVWRHYFSDPVRALRQPSLDHILIRAGPVRLRRA